jgi:hypothetical protein
MEQVVATINYFIREKLWCSIRKLCDMVSCMKSMSEYGQGLKKFTNFAFSNAWITQKT